VTGCYVVGETGFEVKEAPIFNSAIAHTFWRFRPLNQQLRRESCFPGTAHPFPRVPRNLGDIEETERTSRPCCHGTTQSYPGVKGALPMLLQDLQRNRQALEVSSALSLCRCELIPFARGDGVIESSSKLHSSIVIY